MMRVLEYAHLSQFLLHLAHSDVLALLILTFTRPAGWVALGLVAILWSIWFTLRMTQEEVVRMEDCEKGEGQAQEAAAAEPELMIAAQNVPQNLAELARQGIGVKITIELKPLKPATR